MVPQYNVRSPRQDGNLKQRHPANRSKFYNIQDVQQSYVLRFSFIPNCRRHFKQTDRQLAMIVKNKIFVSCDCIADGQRQLRPISDIIFNVFSYCKRSQTWSHAAPVLMGQQVHQTSF